MVPGTVTLNNLAEGTEGLKPLRITELKVTLADNDKSSSDQHLHRAISIDHLFLHTTRRITCLPKCGAVWCNPASSQPGKKKWQKKNLTPSNPRKLHPKIPKSIQLTPRKKHGLGEHLTWVGAHAQTRSYAGRHNKPKDLQGHFFFFYQRKFNPKHRKKWD